MNTNINTVIKRRCFCISSTIKGWAPFDTYLEVFRERCSRGFADGAGAHAAPGAL